MANDFKRFAKPSVGTSTGASADAVYTVRLQVLDQQR